MKTTLLIYSAFYLFLICNVRVLATDYTQLSMLELKEELIAAKASRNLTKVIEIAESLNQRFYDPQSQKNQFKKMEEGLKFERLILFCGAMSTSLIMLFNIEGDALNRSIFWTMALASAVIYINLFNTENDLNNLTLSNAFNSEKEWLQHELQSAELA